MTLMASMIFFSKLFSFLAFKSFNSSLRTSKSDDEQVESETQLSGLQQRWLVAHRPYATDSHVLPYGVQGREDLTSSCLQDKVSLLSKRQPISGPQQIRGPKHVPKPFAHLLHLKYNQKFNLLVKVF